MLIRRTIRGPSTGSFQIAVRTVRPCHATSRGPPTFSDSSRPVIAPDMVTPASARVQGARLARGPRAYAPAAPAAGACAVHMRHVACAASAATNCRYRRRVGREHDERRAAVRDEAEQRRDRAPAGDAQRLDLDADVAGVLPRGPNGGGERGLEGLVDAPSASPDAEDLGDDERRLHVGGRLDGDAGRVGLEARAPEGREDDGPAVSARTGVAGPRTGAPAVGGEGHGVLLSRHGPPPWGAWPG